MPWIVWARWFQFLAVLAYAGVALSWLMRSTDTTRAAADPEWPEKTLLIAAFSGVWLTPLWLWCQTAQMSGVSILDASRTDFVYVLTETRSGHLALTRMGLLGAAALLLWIKSDRRSDLALIHGILGAALLAALAGSGHGMMGPGSSAWIHFAADTLHLFAAAIWFGSLIILAILVCRAARSGSDAHRTIAYRGLVWFSGIGTTVVAMLILSGLINCWFLIGPSGLRRLIASAYGWVLGVKLLFFAAMLVIAMRNRNCLVPRLGPIPANAQDGAIALTALRRNLLAESLLAVLVLLAVGELQELSPPIDAGTWQ